MPLPVGVATATVTFGSPASTFFGGGVATRLTVEPTHALIHRATKAPLLNFIESAEAAEGMPGSITLPLTDQEGFSLASDPLVDFTGWAYKVKGSWSYGGSQISFEKNFQLVAGQTVVDLDEIPGGSITLPVSAPIATVTSVLGKTGAISAEDLGELGVADGSVDEVKLDPAVVTKIDGKLDAVDAADFITETQADASYAPIDAVGGASILDAKVATGSAILNDINEWWVHPVAVGGSGFTFKGTVGAPDESLPQYVGTQLTVTAAPIILSEWRAGYPARSVVAGIINADDHNVPAVMAYPNRRRLAIWSGHYIDNKTTFALSDRSGSLESMSQDMGNAIVFTRTGLTSYAIAILDAARSTATLSYYWLLQRVRRGTSATGYTNGWTITEFTVDETVDTGGLTLISDGSSVGHGQRYLLTNGNGLGYLMGHSGTNGQGNQCWRFIWGYHPSGSGALSRFEIDMVTGAITGGGLASKNAFFTPVDANAAAFLDTELTVLDKPAITGSSRRFFYRERDGYVWAQWLNGDPDNGHYWLTERVPAGPADAANGLLTTAAGYGEAAYAAKLNPLTGFGFECFVSGIPAVPSASIDIARRYLDSTTGSWFLRVDTAGKLSIRIEDASLAAWNYTLPTAIPGLLGATSPIGLRFTFCPQEGGNVAENKIRGWYSTDLGVTWVPIDVGTYTTNPRVLRSSTNPLRFGWGSSAANLTNLAFTKARMWSLTTGTDTVGTDIFDVNFTTDWTPHTGSATLDGLTWTVNGDGVIGTTTPAENYVDHDLGITGPRIGHGEAANYIRGACILTDSTGATTGVVTAHGVDGGTIVKLWKRRANGVWVANVIVDSPDVLARPYQPRGVGGPVGLFLSKINEYGAGENEFTFYNSDALALAAM